MTIQKNKQETITLSLSANDLAIMVVDKLKKEANLPETVKFESLKVTTNPVKGLKRGENQFPSVLVVAVNPIDTSDKPADKHD